MFLQSHSDERAGFGLSLERVDVLLEDPAPRAPTEPQVARVVPARRSAYGPARVPGRDGGPIADGDQPRLRRRRRPEFSPHDLRHRRISLLHLGRVPWATIGQQVGQRNLPVTANTCSHVLADERELDYATLVGE